jgi:hypothetical protein
MFARNESRTVSWRIQGTIDPVSPLLAHLNVTALAGGANIDADNETAHASNRDVLIGPILPDNFMRYDTGLRLSRRKARP